MFRKTAGTCLITCLIFGTVQSQKIFSIQLAAGSGISYFRGAGSSNSTVFYRNGLAFPNSIDTAREAFGRSSHLNFMTGARINLKLIPGWILSIDGQYEQSGGEQPLDSVYSPSGDFKTQGTYQRRYENISINPRLGKRLSLGPVSITLSGGIDYCVKINLSAEGSYTDPSGKHFTIGGTGGTPEVNDLRLTAGATLGFGKWGLDLSYKYGIRDYRQGQGPAVYSRLLNGRLLYRLFGK